MVGNKNHPDKKPKTDPVKERISGVDSRNGSQFKKVHPLADSCEMPSKPNGITPTASQTQPFIALILFLFNANIKPKRIIERYMATSRWHKATLYPANSFPITALAVS